MMPWVYNRGTSSSFMKRWQDIFYRHPLQMYLLIVSSVLEIAVGAVILAIHSQSPQSWMIASGVLLVTVPLLVWIFFILYLIHCYQATESPV